MNSLSSLSSSPLSSLSLSSFSPNICLYFLLGQLFSSLWIFLFPATFMQFVDTDTFFRVYAHLMSMKEGMLSEFGRVAQILVPSREAVATLSLALNAPDTQCLSYFIDADCTVQILGTTTFRQARKLQRGERAGGATQDLHLYLGLNVFACFWNKATGQ